MRLFAAVVPPLELREEIAALVSRAGSGVATRWTPAENLHLTLAFLGEVPPDRLPPVQRAAASAAESATRFDLELQGLGAFDSLARARVLFLRTVGGESQLAALAARLVAELPAELRPQDRRRFSAHLTLARPRTPPRPDELAPLLEALKDRTFRFSADAIAVVESRLSPQGATYHELARTPLRS
jgi:2'-5' RNA ligase